MNEDQIRETPAPSREDSLREQRRRRWKRRRSFVEAQSAGITVLVLGGLLALTALFLLVFPRSTVSEIEKRTLTPFPKFTFSSYFAGDFTSGVASHYDDTVPYRDSFKNLGNRFKGLFGLRSGQNTVTIINKPMNDLEAPAQDEEPAPANPDEAAAASTPGESAAPAPEPEPEEPDQKDFRAEEAEFGLSNGLMVVYQDGHWKCLSLFGGGDGQTYADALNSLQEEVGAKVKIWSMPAPLSSQFYLPSNAEGYSNDQQACMEKVHEQLDARITYVDACPELQKHTEEEIYCRTDHHWQALGAYYACKAFAKAAGVPYLDLQKDFTKEVEPDYVGTMYAYSEDSRILNDPEDFTYYIPKVEYDCYVYDTAFNYTEKHDLFYDFHGGSSYLKFIGGDERVLKVNTKVHNGRKLLVIKDSYGNAEIPFLVGSFEQVYVADMRYFERNLPNFVKAQGITDVLFSMCTYSVVGGNASCLTSLMTQDPDSEIVDEQPAISAKEAAEEAEAQRQAEEEARAAEEEAKAAEEAAEAAAQAAKDAGADAE